MRVSVFHIAVHEIYAESRARANSGEDTSELRNQISSAIGRRSKQWGTSCLFFLVAGILLDGLVEADQVVLPTALGKISFPAIYLAFAASAAFFGLLFNTLTLLVLMSAQANNDNSRSLFTPRPSANSLLSGSDFFDVASPLRGGSFYKVRMSGLLGLLVYVPFLVLLLPIAGAVYKLCQFLFLAITIRDQVFLGSALELSSIALVLFPLAYGVLFFVPLPVFKNKKFIRWTFLFRVTRTSRVHHNAARWLNE